MAEARRRPAASVRVRTTLAAVTVVALALVVGGVALVLLVRAALVDGLESTAEQRAASLVAQVETGTTPTGTGDDEDDDDRDEPDDEVWQVLDAAGRPVAASQPLSRPLPSDDVDDLRLRGSGQGYLVVTEEADDGSVVSVAVSREEVDDSTAALVPLLAIGLPALLLLVGATTWVVAARALAPVERIRSEVSGITGDRLERRVPEPGSRDEVQRLAETMNSMLARLQLSHQRQQQFVADASHELRSPIAAIRQTAEVARAHPGALPEGELAEGVLEEAVRMQRLVEQLLLLTRADEGGLLAEHREVDVDDLALDEARRAGRHGLVVDTSGVGPGRVRGNAVALSQVVRNLVDNAARHAEGRIALRVREVGGQVELVVADDGAGVPDVDRERIFERFVRLDDARSRDEGGSGLGLAIVAEIVRAHDGTVSAGVAELGGASFTVRLPTAG